MNNKAVLVGINYPDTANELFGCVNDVMLMKDILINNFHFDPSNVIVIIDHQATTQNILTKLNWLVTNNAPGDNLYFHYSGHGSQTYNKKSKFDPEPDGVDEILCPIDLNWEDKIILDDDLKDIFNKVPSGCFFTAVLDCCNSGTGMDHDNSYAYTSETDSTNNTNHTRARFIRPPDHMVEGISNLTELQHNIHNRKIRTRNINNTGVMISGCRSDQTSADATINGKPIGACTYFISNILKSSNYQITYKTLIDKLNVSLATNGFTQRPEFHGNAMFHEKHFIFNPQTADIINKSVYVTPTKGTKLQQLVSWIKTLFTNKG